MNEPIVIDVQLAVGLLRDIVGERGHQIPATGGRYVTAGRCGCPVGEVLRRAGMTLDELALLDVQADGEPVRIDAARLPDRVLLTPPARAVLHQAQIAADHGLRLAAVLGAAESEAVLS